MLMQFLEFTYDQAIIIVIALPIIALCLFILTIPWLRNGTGSKLRRYLSYSVSPPKLGANKAEAQEDEPEEPAILCREDKVKLFFFYLAIVLFLVSFMIGEFYEVMIDLMLPVNQGSTGEFRTMISVIFQSPFNAGWIGALPWTGFTTYHETWNWIFFTAAITDNPDFLGTIIFILLLISIGMALAFLSPLAIKSIRQSFLPAMFFFTTGMTIFTKVVAGYFAEALALVLLNVQLEYMLGVVTADMIPDLVVLLATGFLFMLAMFALFIMLGRKLWSVYYTDSKSRTWFMMYITLTFVLGLALTIIMV